MTQLNKFEDLNGQFLSLETGMTQPNKFENLNGQFSSLGIGTIQLNKFRKVMNFSKGLRWCATAYARCVTQWVALWWSRVSTHSWSRSRSSGQPSTVLPLSVPTITFPAIQSMPRCTAPITSRTRSSPRALGAHTQYVLHGSQALSGALDQVHRYAARTLWNHAACRPVRPRHCILALRPSPTK